MELLPKLKAAQSAMTAIIPRLHEARTRWGRTQSLEDKAKLDQVQDEASRLHDAFNDTMQKAQAASGLSSEVLDGLEEPNIDLDPVNRIARSQLTAEQVEPNNSINDILPQALDALIRRLPAGWLEEEPADLFRLPLTDEGQPVSIIKGVRPESEKPLGHRLRQMIQTSTDFLASDPRYDHFSGAMLVPQAARLGSFLDRLESVPNADERITNLWRKSAEVDNTAYELLVAAALDEEGRQPSFIHESHEKTPDIRCNDPFPQVVECKRRQALSGYEQSEEEIMRSLCNAIDKEARKRGLFGVFELVLTIEAKLIDFDEITLKAMLQRLSPYPDRPLDYPWGSIAYREISQRVDLPGVTKAYSPDMLEYGFDWTTDLPEWDGLVCKIAFPEGVEVDEVREGVALAWRNISPTAMSKRSRSPTSLFGSATDQIPNGEHGIVYLAYIEGARESIADNRSHQALERMRDWEHSGMIRIPLVVINRLYPRPLGWGQPDLIESSIPLLSEASGGEPWYQELFPSRIFVPSAGH